MKLYLVAGEASGDLHASNLLKEMKRLVPALECRGWGGDKMKQQGMDLVMHHRKMAFMGFAEVIANLRTILKNIEECKNDIVAYKPDAVILVDYPGFNFRIAKFAHQLGIKVFYYISPQVWAWKRSRVFDVKRYVDRMFVILPFEKAFYKRFNIDVDFVGHPLIDAIDNYKDSILEKQPLNNSGEKVIALLPGSRKQEVRKMLPVMLKAVSRISGYRFVVAGTSFLPPSLYNKIIAGSNTEIVFDETYNLLSCARVALVTSGTATLETALFKVPQVVCYKGSWISVQIAKQLVSINYISLVNLILNKPVVKEMIQGRLSEKNLRTELNRLLSDEEYRNRMIEAYSELEKKLGGSGASKRTAQIMLELMTKS